MVTATISASGLVHMVGSSAVVVGSSGPDSVMIGGFHPAGSVSDPTTPLVKQTVCQFLRILVLGLKSMWYNDMATFMSPPSWPLELGDGTRRG
jgi:hypothetical protein